MSETPTDFTNLDALAAEQDVEVQILDGFRWCPTHQRIHRPHSLRPFGEHATTPLPTYAVAALRVPESETPDAADDNVTPLPTHADETGAIDAELYTGLDATDEPTEPQFDA